MLHKALQNKWARVLIAVFATFLYALGVNLFVVPMGLYSGGVVGLSQIIRTLLAQAVELPAGGTHSTFPFPEDQFPQPWDLHYKPQTKFLFPL